MRAELVRQAVKFGVVGAGNTVLSVAVYAVAAGARVPMPADAAAAFAVGAGNGYVWNRRWTFHAADSRRARGRYVAVQAAGLGETTALVWLLGRAGLGAAVAYAATLAWTTVCTFAANRTWTFRQPVHGWSLGGAGTKTDMDDLTRRRLAHNEELFRHVNEERAATVPAPRDRPVTFVCECSDTTCDARIRLALGDYERVRASPARFVLLPGHEQPELERVVERLGDYHVVEKHAA